MGSIDTPKAHVGNSFVPLDEPLLFDDLRASIETPARDMGCNPTVKLVGQWVSRTDARKQIGALLSGIISSQAPTGLEQAIRRVAFLPQAQVSQLLRWGNTPWSDKASTPTVGIA